MINQSHPRDPVPTSYAYSALFFAAIGLVASAGSVLVVIGGIFAFGRLYITKTLPRISIDGMGLVWAAVLTYYGAGALSAVLNPSDSESVAQLVERLPFLFLPLLLQLFSQSNPEKLLLWAVRGAVVGVFLTVAYGGYWGHFNGSRIAALSGNSNVFGYMCSILFVFLWLGITVITDKKTKLFSGVALLLSAFLVASSGSRASVLAIIMVAAIMAWYYLPWRSVWSRILLVLILVAVVAILMSMTFVGQRTVIFINQVIQSDFDLSKFDPVRVAIWNCGLEIGAEKPLFGGGHNMVLDAMKSCIAESLNRSLRFSHFHNLFVDQFAKGGLIGLLSASFLWLLPILILIDRRNRNGQLPGVALGILGIWSVQTTGALFNIGFGHDVLDAGFIYTNALLFGVMNTRFRVAAPSALEDTLCEEATASMGNNSYIKAFSLGGSFVLVLAVIVFIAIANTTGFNRYTVASGGYALPVEDVNKAQAAAKELQKFVKRFEAELINPNSVIVLPDTERFHAVASVWREEYLKLSLGTRRLQSISVRKNGDNYKILMSGPICPIAVSSGLFEPDARRKSVYETLCSYFSIWKGEGKKY